MTKLVIGDAPLTIDEVIAVARGGAEVTLGAPARERIQAAYAVVADVIAREQVAYGVTTGFGLLATTHIPVDKVQELQQNLVRSHAVGLGAPLSREVVRAAMTIRLNTMARGHSGVRLSGGRAPGRVHQRRHHPVGAVARLAGRLRRPRPVRAPRARDDGRGRAADGGRAARAERACPAGRRARAPLARSQRGPQPPERHPVHGRHRLHAGRRRRGAPGLRRPDRRDEPGGPARLRRPLRGAHPGAASHPRPAGHGGQRPPRDRRERDHAQPPELRQGAGRLLAALHPAGARRLPRRARLAAARRSASRSTPSPTTRSSSRTRARSSRPATSTGSRSRWRWTWRR